MSIIRSFFKWVFKDELSELQSALSDIEEIKSQFEVSVDVNYKSNSWAVVSLEGHKDTFIKFINLKDSEIKEIANFLRRYNRHKIDADPQTTHFLRINKN